MIKFGKWFVRFWVRESIGKNVCLCMGCYESVVLWVVLLVLRCDICMILVISLLVVIGFVINLDMLVFWYFCLFLFIVFVVKVIMGIFD